MHRHRHKTRQTLIVPAVPPKDEVLGRLPELEAFANRMKDRDTSRRHNGMPSNDRKPEVLAKRAQLFAQLEQLPPAQLTEYVLDYDDSGNVIGLKSGA